MQLGASVLGFIFPATGVPSTGLPHWHGTDIPKDLPFLELFPVIVAASFGVNIFRIHKSHSDVIIKQP